MFIRRIAEDRALCYRGTRLKKAMKPQKLRIQENSPWKLGIEVHRRTYIRPFEFRANE